MIRRDFLSTILRSTAGIVASRPLLARIEPRQVLAFYYGWYANPQVSGRWEHWPDGIAHEPDIGRYDSHDPKIIESAVSQAKSAGITGFIVSWWRPRDFQDQGMPLMLAAAEKAGLKITIYYEAAKPRLSPTPQATADDLLDILGRYGDHPAWLRARNNPVVFVYSRAIKELQLAGWARVMALVRRRYRSGVCFVGDDLSPAASKVFDGIHSYNPTSLIANLSIDEIRAWAHSAYPKWIAAAGKRISCVTVIPGYDDTRLNRPGPRPTTNRENGETYRVLWREAIAARPDWVLITSWNEWHEGSEIEPSKENGDRELNATREFAQLFIGQ